MSVTRKILATALLTGGLLAVAPAAQDSSRASWRTRCW